ncbi:MAG: metal-dependent hydrolase [Bacteroidota bacterium]
MKLTYYGHACVLVEFGGKKLLFDPFITPNEKAASVDVASIKADYILLSHGHQDHVADAEQIARQSGATIIAAYEIVSWYGEKGINGHPMNIGGKWRFDFGTVKMVNAIHSSMLPDGTYGANPAGFVIWNEEACFYFAGDTALTMDMKLIPLTCPELDFAVLPVGDNFTMGYEDATIAADFIECNTIVGCHYDTFGYITIDHQEAQETFTNKGKKLILPEIGSTIKL